MSAKFKVGDTVYIVTNSAKPRRILAAVVVKYSDLCGLYKVKYTQRLREWWLRRRPWFQEKDIRNLEEAVAWKLMR